MNLRIISQILAIIVILGGIIVMFGWFLDVPLLKSILPFWVSMKFITALSFLGSGILLLLLSLKEKNEAYNFLILIISFAIFLLMVTFLISLFMNISTGIESLFFKETAGAVKTTVPGVPAIPTIICFILIALSGLIFSYDSETSVGYVLSGILITLIGGLAVLGYLINIPIFYYTFEGYTSMAFHTAIFFVLLGIGLILLVKEDER